MLDADSDPGVQMTDASCATCGMAFETSDLIPINGTPEQIESLKAALPGRQRKSKSNNRKKRKRSDCSA